MATANEEDLNAALNTPSGQEPPPRAEPEPESDPDPEVDPVDPPDPELEPDPEADPPERELTPAERRFQKLANERAEAQAARVAAERERDFYRQQALAKTQPAQPEEELDADERWRRQANERIQRTEFMAADTSDRSTFLTKYAKNPEVLAMVDEVEARLAAARSQGHNGSRENFLKFIMGERQLERLSKAPAVRKQAADRVNAAKGSPLGAKSNVASPGKSEPSLQERLKDVPL